jgi:hypothetical protein
MVPALRGDFISKKAKAVPNNSPLIPGEPSRLHKPSVSCANGAQYRHEYWA